MTTSLLRPARRLATLLVVATALSGCATVSDWWNGSDNAPKPIGLKSVARYSDAILGAHAWP